MARRGDQKARVVVLLAVCLLVGWLDGRAAGQQKPLTKPQPASKETRIQRLIQQLGHDDYAVRERAQGELAKFGFDAYDELSAATAHADLEVANRARYLLRLIRVQWTSENDPPPVRSLLQDYEIQTPAVRLRRIVRLAGLSRSGGLPALCRLVRFERSPLLSKFAAIEILRKEPSDPVARSAYHKVLREQLDKSRQTAAAWLTTYLRLRDDLEGVLPEWTKLVDEEVAVLRRSAEQSNPEFVAGLIYQQALLELERGKTDAAEATAQRARESATFSRRGRPGSHLDTAFALRERGLFRWAEAEYRRVIAGNPSVDWVRAQIGLSEMLHDRGKHLAAAEARQEILRAIDQGKLRGQDMEALQMTTAEIQARMAYMFACHWAEQGDQQKHRKYLEEAIEADSAEIDALIACYRLPDQTPEHRKKIVSLIERVASELLTEIEDQPDNPNGYNQYAWLIGNTEGDLDKALQFCEKALQLSPESGAFCDTLGRVYFTRGDLDNAVKYQARAHELEPHSGLIAKQLKAFREAQAKKKGSPSK